jgi:hypothetical protein
MTKSLLNNDSMFEDTRPINELLFETHRTTLNILGKHVPILADLLAILSSLMSLLRKCRVNAAFTIQIFSHVFLSMNLWLFNRIVCYSNLNLCSFDWGETLIQRLTLIRQWSETQGLEFIYDCYLNQVKQVCRLLIHSKCDQLDVQTLVANDTWSINTIQTRQILSNYISKNDEQVISNSFTQAYVVRQHVHSSIVCSYLERAICLSI